MYSSSSAGSLEQLSVYRHSDSQAVVEASSRWVSASRRIAQRSGLYPACTAACLERREDSRRTIVFDLVRIETKCTARNPTLISVCRSALPSPLPSNWLFLRRYEHTACDMRQRRE